MDIRRTFSGLEATLTLRGVGRFFSAGFLLVWLTGWLVGEALVLWLLIVGAKSLVTGEPPEPGRDPLAVGPSLAMGLFLLTWLALWTFGGVAAMHEMLRLLWSRDRLLVRQHVIEVRRRVGWLSSLVRIERSELRGIRRRESGSALIAETRSGAIELTRLGQPAEQERLAAAIREEMKLGKSPPLPPALPEEWVAMLAPESGSQVLVKDPATRRRQAMVAWIVTVPVCAVAGVLAHASFNGSSLLGLTILVGSAALALCWGAGWLSFTRTEWRLEPTRIVQQRRTGSRVRPLFEGNAIVLDTSTDSDGDVWYGLELIAPAYSDASSAERRRVRRTLLRRMNDPTTPRRLAEWIVERTGVAFSESSESGYMKTVR